MNIINEHLNPEYYDLNTCDIWYFERLYFMNVEKNVDLGQKIISEIQSLIMNNKDTEPAYDVRFYDEGDADAKRKYSLDINKFFNNLSYPEKIFELQYFFHDNACYEYYAGVNIIRNQAEESLFQFFFALKLRQYSYALIHTSSFLDHQLISNFNEERETFIEFLIYLLRQYSGLFSEELIETVNDYMNRLRKEAPTDLIAVRSFLLVGYRDYGKEYFIKNVNVIFEAFIGLKDNKFIDPDTKLDQFKRIFTQSTIQPDRRIMWIGRNVELKWFVQILIDDLTKIVPPIVGRWKTTLYCFADKNGTDFEKEEAISKASGKADERTNVLRKILENL
jgi:hypothetical protein